MPDYDATDRARRQNRRLLLGVGALIGLAWLAMLGHACRRPRQDPPAATPAIAAEVQLQRAQVVVTNRNAFAWTQVTVRLNPGLTGRYDCPVGTVAPGATITLALDDCTTDDGTRFDWRARKPTAVAVKTAQGDQYFGATR